MPSEMAMALDLVYCGACSQTLPAAAFALDKARSTGRRYRCRDCSAVEYRRWKATPGYGIRLVKSVAARKLLVSENPKARWARDTANNTRRRAKLSGLPFNLTTEWLLASALDVCPALNIPLVYNATASFRDNAAVDRIDNDRGYTTDNCWVISMLANRIKTNATHFEIAAVAEALARKLAERNQT